MPARRWTGRHSLAGLVVGAILLATLTPSTSPPVSYTCIICGERGLSDAIANILLFVPLGMAIAALPGPRRSTLWVLPTVLSFCIEFSQQFIPGRDPSLGDVLFNSLGGVAGIAIVRAAWFWLQPTKRVATTLSTLAACGFALVIALTGFLLQPDFPATVYWGLWMPDLGHLEWYRGRLVDARIGSEPLVSGPMPNQPVVHQALRTGAPVVLRGFGGPPVKRLGAIFAIYDQNQQEILLIGPRGNTLVLRYRMHATAIGLDQPEILLEDGMRTIAPGAAFEVNYRRERRGVCLSVADGAGQCELGFSPGRGWSLVDYPVTIPTWLMRGLDSLWLALLVLPIGFWSARPRDLVTGGGIAMVAVLAVPGWVGLHHATVVELLVVVGSMILGRQLHNLIGAMSPRVGRRSPEASA